MTARKNRETPTLIILKKLNILEVVGIDDAEGTPVPIPNTEVKVGGAENTWPVTARKNREMPTLIILNSSAGRACGC